MSNQVYANGMEVSCKQASGKAICAFPDVCFTPPQTPATPPGMPLPYPNTGMASDTSDGSRTVKISGQEVMLKDKSCFKRSSGDEAGCSPKKGVVTSKNTGKVYFNAWSMSVLVEGENVVRHLDLTTHNHASKPGATPPWPYADEAAKADGGACNKAPPEDYVEQVKRNCKNMQSEKCCNTPGRKCMLLPFDPNGCCSKNGKQMTGHHLVFSAEFVPWKKRASRKPSRGYVSDKAPCLCVEGTDHTSSREPGRPNAPTRLMEHGRVARAYVRLRRCWLRNNETLTVDNACTLGAKAGRVVRPECSEECLKAQLLAGHPVKGDQPVPRLRKHKPKMPTLFKVVRKKTRTRR